MGGVHASRKPARAVGVPRKGVKCTGTSRRPVDEECVRCTSRVVVVARAGVCVPWLLGFLLDVLGMRSVLVL